MTILHVISAKDAADERFRFCAQLSERLMQQGHRVVIVTEGPLKKTGGVFGDEAASPPSAIRGLRSAITELLRAFRTEPDLPWAVGAEGASSSGSLRRLELPGPMGSWMWVRQHTQQLSALVAAEEIALLHAWGWGGAGLAAFVARRTGRPLVMSVPGAPTNGWRRLLVASAQAVVVTSAWMGQRLRRDFGVPVDRIQHIPQAVEGSQERPALSKVEGSSATRWIGLIGGMPPSKGYTDFLKALSRVVRHLPHVKARVITGLQGSADRWALQEVELFAKRFGLGRSLEFVDGAADLGEAFSSVEGLVLSSVPASRLGPVALGAAVQGVPVVAVKLGGVEEFVQDRHNGLVVLPDDPLRLSSAILQLLEDRALADLLVGRARQEVEAHHQLTHAVAATLAVYRRVVEQPKVLAICRGGLTTAWDALPRLVALRARAPQSHLHLLASQASREFFRHYGELDRLWLMAEGPPARRLGSAMRLTPKLLREGFDHVIDLTKKQPSRWIQWATLSFQANGRAGSSLVEAGDALVGSVPRGTQTGGGVVVEENHLTLRPSQVHHRAVARLLAASWVGSKQRLVGLALRADEVVGSGRWTLERLAKLCDALAHRNVRVVICGSRQDRPLAKRVLALTTSRPIDAVGKCNFLEWAALLQRCQVVIGLHPLPLRVAGAVGVPTLALVKQDGRPSTGAASPDAHVVSDREIARRVREPSLDPQPDRPSLDEALLGEVLRVIQPYLMGSPTSVFS